MLKNKNKLWFEIIIIFKDETLNFQGIKTLQNFLFIQKWWRKKHAKYLENYTNLL
jgi:hypothetical protein